MTVDERDPWDDSPPYVEMVPCPVCGAQVGELCQTEHGKAHEERIKATLEGLE